MEDLLEDLGLTAYEARALHHLLRHGDRTGPDLSREAGIPFGRVYDTLNALVERGLVTVQTGRPKRYAPLPAETLPGRLMASNRRRLQLEEKELEARARRLEEEVVEMGAHREPGSHAYGIRLGEDSARAFLIDATHEAKDHVLAYLAFERIQDDDLNLFEAFRHAVGRGLKTRILLRAGDIDYLMTTPYVDEVLETMLPHIGDNLQVRLTWDDVQPFAAIDARRVMLGIKNPLDPNVYFAVVHVEDEAFAGGLTAKFEAMWDQAEEPRDLVQWALGRKGGRALLKFGARMRGRGREP